MLRFVKQIFISAMMFFSCNLSNVNILKHVLMENQDCKIWPQIVNVNIMYIHFILIVLK